MGQGIIPPLPEGIEEMPSAQDLPPLPDGVEEVTAQAKTDLPPLPDGVEEIEQEPSYVQQAAEAVAQFRKKTNPIAALPAAAAELALSGATGVGRALSEFGQTAEVSKDIATGQDPGDIKPLNREASFQQPFDSGDLNPFNFAPKITYLVGNSIPMMAGSLVGEAAGGPAGGVAAGGVLSGLQRFGPTYVDLRSQGKTHEDALRSAQIAAGISTVAGAVGYGAFKIAPAENALTNLALQTAVVQPGLAVGEQAFQNKFVYEKPWYSDWEQAAIGSVGSTIALEAGMRYAGVHPTQTKPDETVPLRDEDVAAADATIPPPPEGVEFIDPETGEIDPARADDAVLQGIEDETVADQRLADIPEFILDQIRAKITKGNMEEPSVEMGFDDVRAPGKTMRTAEEQATVEGAANDKSEGDIFNKQVEANRRKPVEDAKSAIKSLQQEDGASTSIDDLMARYNLPRSAIISALSEEGINVSKIAGQTRAIGVKIREVPPTVTEGNVTAFPGAELPKGPLRAIGERMSQDVRQRDGDSIEGIAPREKDFVESSALIDSVHRETMDKIKQVIHEGTADAYVQDGVPRFVERGEDGRTRLINHPEQESRLADLGNLARPQDSEKVNLRSIDARDIMADMGDLPINAADPRVWSKGTVDPQDLNRILFTISTRNIGGKSWEGNRPAYQGLIDAGVRIAPSRGASFEYVGKKPLQTSPSLPDASYRTVQLFWGDQVGSVGRMPTSNRREMAHAIDLTKINADDHLVSLDPAAYQGYPKHVIEALHQQMLADDPSALVRLHQQGTKLPSAIDSRGQIAMTDVMLVKKLPKNSLIDSAGGMSLDKRVPVTVAPDAVKYKKGGIIRERDANATPELRELTNKVTDEVVKLKPIIDNLLRRLGAKTLPEWVVTEGGTPFADEMHSPYADFAENRVVFPSKFFDGRNAGLFAGSLESQVLNIALHEVGHLVTVRSWGRLPGEVRGQAYDAYNRAMLRFNKFGDYSHFETGVAGEGEAGTYHLSFVEWQAEQFKRFALADTRFQGDIGKWYGEVGKHQAELVKYYIDREGVDKAAQRFTPTYEFHQVMDYLEHFAREGEGDPVLLMRSRFNLDLHDYDVPSESRISETLNQINDIAREFQNEIGQLSDVYVGVTAHDITPEQMAGGIGFGSFQPNTGFQGNGGVIRLMAGALAWIRDPVNRAIAIKRTMIHETWHAIESIVPERILKQMTAIADRMKYFTPEDHARYERYAREEYAARGMRGEELEAQVAKMIEREKRAYLIEEMRNGQRFESEVNRSFDMIKTFFERVGNLLLGNGFRNAEDVMHSFMKGELTKRYNKALEARYRPRSSPFDFRNFTPRAIAGDMKEGAVGLADMGYKGFDNLRYMIQTGRSPVGGYERVTNVYGKGQWQLGEHQPHINNPVELYASEKGYGRGQGDTKLQANRAAREVKGAEKRPSEHTDEKEFYIMKDGKPVGTFSGWLGNDGVFHVSLMATNEDGLGSNAIGRQGLRQLRDALSEVLPEAKSFAGNRAYSMKTGRSAEGMVKSGRAMGKHQHIARFKLENPAAKDLGDGMFGMVKTEGKISTFAMFDGDGKKIGYMKIEHKADGPYIDMIDIHDQATMRRMVREGKGRLSDKLFNFAEKYLETKLRSPQEYTRAGYKWMKQRDPEMVFGYTEVNGLWMSPKYVRDHYMKVDADYREALRTGSPDASYLKRSTEVWKSRFERIPEGVFQDKRLVKQWSMREFELSEWQKSQRVEMDNAREQITGQAPDRVDPYNSLDEKARQIEQALNAQVTGYSFGAEPQVEMRNMRRYLGRSAPDPETAKYLKSAVNHGDVMWKQSKNWLTIHQLAWKHPTIQWIRNYLSIRENQVQRSMEHVSQAHEIARSWEQLHNTQRDNLSKLFFWATEMRYRTAQEVSNKVTRQYSRQELMREAQRLGLGKAALDVFDKVNGHFGKFLSQMEAIFDSQITKQFANNPSGEAVARAKLKADMAKLRSKPYFPMTRFGKYTLTVKDANGKTIWFSSYESAKAQNDAIKDVYARNGNREVIASTMPEEVHDFQGLPKPMLDRIISDMPGLSSVQTEWLQRFSHAASPENSFRKRWLEREGTPGYSLDGIRAYADYFRRGSRYLSRLEFRDALAENQAAAKADIAQFGFGNSRQMMLDMITNHSEWMDKPGKDYTNFKSFITNYYLGFSPAAAMVNLTQVPFFTVPYLTNLFGAKAMAKIAGDTTNAMKRTWSHLDPKLGPQFLEAHAEMIAQGKIDTGQAAELGSFADSSNLDKTFAGTTAQKFWRGFGHASMFMFGKAERFNREWTFRTAFELAMEQPNSKHVKDISRWYAKEILDLEARRPGMSTEAATAFYVAREAIDRTQGVYQAWDRPRAFRHPVVNTFAIFMSYLQQTMFAFGNNPGKGMTLAMMGVAYGLQGLPGSEDIDNTINAFSKQWAGKDFSPHKWVREQVREMSRGTAFDKIAPDLAMHGLSRFSGMGIGMLPEGWGVPRFDASANGSMGEILPGLSPFMKAYGNAGTDPNQYKIALADALKDAAGAGYGPGLAMMQMLMSPPGNDTWKKWEGVFPRAVKAVSKAARMYSDEGLTSQSGARVVKMDVTDPDDRATIVAQALGFTPTKASQYYDMQQEFYAQKQFYAGRKLDLMVQLNYAVTQKDQPAKEQVIQKIKDYNKELKSMGLESLSITRNTVSTSLKNRARNQAMEEMGLPAQKSMISLRKRAEDMHPGMYQQKVK